jgi:hypothetical protein
MEVPQNSVASTGLLRAGDCAVARWLSSAAIEAMHVAGQHQRISGAAAAQGIQQALARCGITIPAIGPEAAITWLLMDRHLADDCAIKRLLRKNIPARA